MSCIEEEQLQRLYDSWDEDLKSMNIDKKCPKCGKALRLLTDKKIDFCENPYCNYSRKTYGSVI
jgi:ssDNA-binding Zn-finger/Zn-ribbon topoisomerase 1